METTQTRSDKRGDPSELCPALLPARWGGRTAVDSVADCRWNGWPMDRGIFVKLIWAIICVQMIRF